MPKAAAGASSVKPLSGLFAIAKPSGPTSMHMLDELKTLLASSSLFYPPDAPPPFSAAARNTKRAKPWERALLKKCGRLPPKIGQGGTLDPLAEGVLVIGIGDATKRLQDFLHCTKEYRVTGLLGTSTTSYDSQEPVLQHAPHHHVTAELVRARLASFTGAVQQIPPLYSALRMDGKRLFEYAREGVPLPRPIAPRDVHIEALSLLEWLPHDTHDYKPPADQVPAEDVALFAKVRDMAGRSHALDTVSDSAPLAPATPPHMGSDVPPAAFTLEMTVSSGTYVRSIVHDLGAACGSAAHVVRLIRTRQGKFALGEAHAENEGDVHAPPSSHTAIPWHIFETGLEELAAARTDGTRIDARDAQGLCAWERAILEQYVYTIF
ncbi:tRNA pseudouridine(55) synthase [Malassezia vespertilionis]|uniref:tRNA pseudouridine(55) synthase n=1 Tax=Malassezia vespertilionis TaxID=2020962 RepID=A0A2N1J7A5_9BASI|nr:tRNA pseudouridine(55) synthase [Malassezia vespertilionis]PKI82424.1 hypothetical protein MVES_003632 [Malassezia vespertilionis]WFD08022.1 tRNA pseudouridine(55) synthase [Malassezia vespertilionis]